MSSRQRVIAVGPPDFRHEVAKALGVSPESVGWAPATSDAADVLKRGQDRVEVVVLSPDVMDRDAFELTEVVSSSSPATAVVVTRAGNLNGMLPRYMRAGIRDVVDLSYGSDDLAEALTRAIMWSHSVWSARPDDDGGRAGGRGGQIFLVFSSKGGTGKTFLATNLAAAIAARSKRDTLVLDLDFAMGDVFSFFGKEPTRAIQDLIQLGSRADEEMIRTAATALGPHLWGLGAPPDPAAEPVSSDSIARLLRQLRDAFDYIVLDAPAEYSDAVLTAMDVADDVLLLSALDVVGIKHMSKALETLTAIGVPWDRLRIVLNRADSKVGLSPDDVEKVMKVSIDAMIPSSRLVPMSLNHGQPVVTDEPKADVSKAVHALADKLVTLVGAAPNEDTAADGSEKSRKRALFRKG